jgi:hypothetical protein
VVTSTLEEHITSILLKVITHYTTTCYHSPKDRSPYFYYHGNLKVPCEVCCDCDFRQLFLIQYRSVVPRTAGRFLAIRLKSFPVHIQQATPFVVTILVMLQFLYTAAYKVLVLFWDRKLHFHWHVDYIYSQAWSMLRLICYSTYNSYLTSVYNALIRLKFRYAPAVWDNLTLTDPN